MTAATKTKPKAPDAPAERLTKKELTLTEAVAQWKDAKRAIDEAKPLLEEAAPIILEYLLGKKLNKYRGIGLSYSSAKLILDQPKIREYLGSSLKDFQKRTTPSPSLTLLEKPKKT